MLTKLLKYDLKPVIKLAAIFGISILACTLLVNVTSYDHTLITNEEGIIVGFVPDAPEIQQALHTLFYVLVSVLGIVFIIMMILNTWKSFYKSFYSDTAYLTHTLPVSRRTLWISKILAALTANFILVAIMTVICCILQATPNGRGIATGFGWQYDAPTAYYPAWIINVFTILNIIACCGLVGMVLGHRMRSKRQAFSIIWSCILALSIIIIVGWISDIWTGLSRNDDSYINLLGITGRISAYHNASYALTNIIGMLAVNLCTIAALYYIGDRSLQKGINLD